MPSPSLRPQITVEPGMLSGQPCINGTRVPVLSIAGSIWSGESVAEVAGDYDITRADVLVACWYAGTYGLPGERSKRLAGTRYWRDRLGNWAQQVGGAVWSAHEVADYDAIPDPPDRTEAGEPR